MFATTQKIICDNKDVFKAMLDLFKTKGIIV